MTEKVRGRQKDGDRQTYLGAPPGDKDELERVIFTQQFTRTQDVDLDREKIASYRTLSQ